MSLLSVLLSTSTHITSSHPLAHPSSLAYSIEYSSLVTVNLMYAFCVQFSDSEDKLLAVWRSKKVKSRWVKTEDRREHAEEEEAPVNNFALFRVTGHREYAVDTHWLSWRRWAGKVWVRSDCKGCCRLFKLLPIQVGPLISRSVSQFGWLSYRQICSSTLQLAVFGAVTHSLILVPLFIIWYFCLKRSPMMPKCFVSSVCRRERGNNWA